MKKITLTLFMALTAITFYQCSSTKKTASASKPEVTLLASAQKRWPDATQAKLDAGNKIYNGPCARCHGAKEISKWNEVEWEKILNNMAPKAKLTADEKETVRQYILATVDQKK